MFLCQWLDKTNNLCQWLDSYAPFARQITHKFNKLINRIIIIHLSE